MAFTEKISQSFALFFPGICLQVFITNLLHKVVLSLCVAAVWVQTLVNW